MFLNQCTRLKMRIPILLGLCDFVKQVHKLLRLDPHDLPLEIYLPLLIILVLPGLCPECRVTCLSDYLLCLPPIERLHDYPIQLPPYLLSAHTQLFNLLWLLYESYLFFLSNKVILLYVVQELPHSDIRDSVGVVSELGLKELLVEVDLPLF